MTPSSLDLNDPQRNTLAAAFKYTDRLLSEALAGLAPAAEGAIFTATLADATPVQCKVIIDQAARLRRALRAALDACAIPVTPPRISALWNLRCTLTSIDIALEDLGPDHLRGYGGVDETTAAHVVELRAQIRTVLTELLAYLESGLGGDLAARLARLDQTRDEVRLLRELERIVTAHGMVELRTPLGRLLDRLERNWWTVAFIGRVSSGKSSLLNFLLATEVLPTGVTPITAVPIRIVAGPTAAAVVHLANEKPRRIPTAQLAEFASEEHNPGNRRLVTDVQLELPTDRLAGDICLVDTPGLGSLATAGATQTLAFLPRCDLGVLLLDATAAPGEEDVAVARTLLESGADVLLVLSKADLLTAADREKALRYAQGQFAAAVGRALPVAPVSVAPGHTGLADQWFAAELAPRQSRHHELATSGLRRKIGALRDAVAAALAARAGLEPSPLRPGPAPDAVALGAARAALENSRRELYDLAQRVTPAAATVLAAAAGVLARSPAGDESTDALARELNRTAARIGAAFDLRLREVRDGTATALPSLHGNDHESTPLPSPSGRPLFDPAPVLAAGRLPGGWRRWPAAFLRRAALRRQLRGRLGGALDEALRAYSRALIRWSERYLDELTGQFNAHAGFAEARSVAPGTTPAASEAMRRDYELLRGWDTRSAA